MSTWTASAIFLGWLVALFFAESVVLVYGFNYFDGALGSQAANLFLSVVLYALLALVITVGFAAVLKLRAHGKASFRGWRLALAATVAYGLFQAPSIAGRPLDVLGSWEARLAVILVYSALVGAVIGFGMLRFSKDAHYAA